MARHLTDRDIEAVVGLLDGWKDKLTWDRLCDACEATLGTRPSRQTLHRHARIKEAYKLTKERLKDADESLSLPPTMKAAAERLARLEAENERLRRENESLLEQFVRWQYNAYARGLSDRDLNGPLPAIDRGNTG